MHKSLRAAQTLIEQIVNRATYQADERNRERANDLSKKLSEIWSTAQRGQLVREQARTIYHLSRAAESMAKAGDWSKALQIVESATHAAIQLIQASEQSEQQHGYNAPIEARTIEALPAPPGRLLLGEGLPGDDTQDPIDIPGIPKSR